MLEELNWINRRGSGQKEIVLKYSGGVPYFQFPLLDQTGMVNHCFSTRLGGVSTGCYESMNLSPSKADSPENVRENYRRLCEAIGVDLKKTVLSRQTHTTVVRKVAVEDCGKGLFRQRDYDNVDGLMTDIPGIVLVTFYADCVPLYFLDPVHRAAAVSHSGWKGTAAAMGARTLEAMNQAYGTRPEDVLACIGPSICQAGISEKEQQRALAAGLMAGEQRRSASGGNSAGASGGYGRLYQVQSASVLFPPDYGGKQRNSGGGHFTAGNVRYEYEMAAECETI